MTLDFLLGRIAAGDRRPVAMVRYTLDRMADGGIRDQLGGGFHRYATDPIWLVPHFEQMLYDNAQLARTYLRAWAVARDRALSRRGRSASSSTCSASCAAPMATFAASQDADTDGVEGATFTWTAAEIREVLGDDAPLVHRHLRRPRRGQLGGPDDPVADRAGRRRRRARSIRARSRRGSRLRAGALLARRATPAAARA